MYLAKLVEKSKLLYLLDCQSETNSTYYEAILQCSGYYGVADAGFM